MNGTRNIMLASKIKLAMQSAENGEDGKARMQLNGIKRHYGELAIRRIVGLR